MSLCPSFSVTNTNFATINYATCSFTACPGDIVVMSTLSPGSCNGDTFLRLYDPTSGNQLTFNDDYDGSFCSQITYTLTLSCRACALRQGCYSSSTCGGQITYSGNTIPTQIPSIIPETITSLQFTNNPSQLPSIIHRQLLGPRPPCCHYVQAFQSLIPTVPPSITLLVPSLLVLVIPW